MPDPIPFREPARRPALPVYSWQTETSQGLFECRLFREVDQVVGGSTEPWYRATITVRGALVFRGPRRLRPPLAALDALDYMQNQILIEIEREVSR